MGKLDIVFERIYKLLEHLRYELRPANVDLLEVVRHVHELDNLV
jgi:hypothetical protein